MVIEAPPIACPRCQSGDVAASECASCGGLSRVLCRACGHDGCRDVLCELRTHDRGFRRRLSGMLLLIGMLTVLLLRYAAPLQQIQLARPPPPEPARLPSVDESAAVLESPAASATPA